MGLETVPRPWPLHNVELQLCSCAGAGVPARSARSLTGVAAPARQRRCLSLRRSRTPTTTEETAAKGRILLPSAFQFAQTVVARALGLLVRAVPGFGFNYGSLCHPAAAANAIAGIREYAGMRYVSVAVAAGCARRHGVDAFNSVVPVRISRV